MLMISLSLHLKVPFKILCLNYVLYLYSNSKLTKKLNYYYLVDSYNNVVT